MDIREGLDYFTKERRSEYGRTQVYVYGWGVYPSYSVLAGQARKVFCDSFDTEAQADAAYPGTHWSSQWMEPQVSLNHLPDENDPVPGGMYPDDFTEEGER